MSFSIPMRDGGFESSLQKNKLDSQKKNKERENVRGKLKENNKGQYTEFNVKEENKFFYRFRYSERILEKGENGHSYIIKNFVALLDSELKS